MSPSNPANLVGNEHVVGTASIHWWFAYGASVILGIAGVLLGIAFAVGVGGGPGFGVFGLFVVAAAVAGGVGYVRMTTTEFVITSRRVSAKTGFLNRHSIETLLIKIEGAAVKQDWLGALLGFGTIVVNGVGGTHEGIPGVRNPQAFRAILQQQIALAHQGT